MKRIALGSIVAALAVMFVGTALGGTGTPINEGSADAFTMAVYGDSPYGTTPIDTAQFDSTAAFIDSINADPKVRLVMHRQHDAARVAAADGRPAGE